MKKLTKSEVRTAIRDHLKTISVDYLQAMAEHIDAKYIDTRLREEALRDKIDYAEIQKLVMLRKLI
jgi:hypothetical protein